MSSLLVEDLMLYRKRLECLDQDHDTIESILTLLKSAPMTYEILRSTKIGVSVNKLKNHANATDILKKAARDIVDSWRSLKPSTNGNTENGTSKPTPCDNAPGDNETSKTISVPVNFDSSRYSGPIVKDMQRNKARSVLWASFMEGMEADLVATINPQVAMNTAAEIEEGLSRAHKDSKAYMAQLKAVRYNLRDRENTALNHRLLTGEITPADLAVLPSHEMASDDKKKQREAYRQVRFIFCFLL
eukprot:GHVR01146329.1.p1 GENE.GHVR01146329.1~~GHVR01146329.1.p1  ORF type:complete len:245 (+),score=45.10 GHVR01146329.1:43-777(+)